MTKYDISLLGTIWSVITLRADDPPPKDIPEHTVYILPHLAADVCALCSACAEWELVMLLSFYYRSVLGYPKCSLEVLSDGKSIEVEIFDTPPHLTGMKLQKCKLLSTNLHRMPDLTEHTLYTACAGAVYRIIPVCSARDFRPSVLSTLRAIAGLPTAVAAVGLSDDGVILGDGTSPSPSLVSAAALCHPDFSLGEVTLSVVDVKYTVRDGDCCTRVYTPASLVGKTVI